MNTFITAGIGELLWDMLPSGKKWGGAPGNFARHCANLGCESTVISAVGNDELGQGLIDDAIESDLECIVPVVDKPTGIVNVTLNDAGVPQYDIVKDVAWDFIPLTEEMSDLAGKLDVLCFGTLAQRSATSRNTIKSLIEQVSPDCLKICDINLRQHYYSDDLIQECVDLADMLKINDDELPIVAEAVGCSGDDQIELAQRVLEKYSLKWLVLTCGPKGSIVVSKDEIAQCGTQDIEVVDTVGAGDSFTAAITVCLLRGKPIDVANRLASEVADYVCSCAGAVPKLPEDLVQRLYK